MAYVNGGKHFGQYTYEHWFDHEYENKNNIMIDEIDYVSEKENKMDILEKITFRKLNKNDKELFIDLRIAYLVV